MLRDEAVTIVRGRLGRIGNTDLDAYIVTEMQLAQTELEEGIRLPWFLFTEKATADGTANEERLKVPDDMLMEYEEGALFLTESDGTYTEVLKDDYDALVNAYPTAGKPLKYALTGDYFRLKPTPSIVYTFMMLYYQQATVLSTNVENQWLKYAPMVLIGKAGQAIARYVRDANALGLFKSDFDMAMEAMWRKDEMRKHTNREYLMGDD